MKVFAIKNFVTKNRVPVCKIKNKIGYSVKNVSNSSFMVVTVPLVLYKTTKKITEERIIKKTEEAANRVVPNDTQWYEKQSRKELKTLGVTKESEQNKYINSDGTLDKDEVKKLIKNKSSNSVSHKGRPENDVSDDNLYSYAVITDASSAGELLEDPDLVINDGLDLIDVALPEDLKVFLEQNPLEISEGFFDTLKDVVLDGIEGLDDAFDNIKDCIDKLGDLIS